MEVKELDVEMMTSMRQLDESQSDYQEQLKDLIVDALWRAGMIKTAAEVQKLLEPR